MKASTSRSILACSALASILVLTACAKKTDATVANFTAAMNEYLAQRGDLCLGKSTWPIDVTERDTLTGARDAVQMPVLEKLGLVSSADAIAEIKDEDQVTTVPARRYQLTEAGKRYYLSRETGAVTPTGEKVLASDLCAARLSLDKVVGWKLGDGEQRQAIVTYTYHVEAPEWIETPEARRVFPAVDRVLRGEGAAQLTEGFVLTEQGWVANELAPARALVAEKSPR